MTEGPPIPTLEQVKTIIGDRVQEWTDEQLMAACAYIDILARRNPPKPETGHIPACAFAKAILDPKGILCTCRPNYPK